MLSNVNGILKTSQNTVAIVLQQSMEQRENRQRIMIGNEWSHEKTQLKTWNIILLLITFILNGFS